MPINTDKVMIGTITSLRHQLDKTKSHIADLMIKTGDIDGARELLRYCNDLHAALNKADSEYYEDEG